MNNGGHAKETQSTSACCVRSVVALFFLTIHEPAIPNLYSASERALLGLRSLFVLNFERYAAPPSIFGLSHGLDKALNALCMHMEQGGVRVYISPRQA